MEKQYKEVWLFSTERESSHDVSATWFDVPCFWRFASILNHFEDQ
jgi:hypothetical protein